MECANDSKRVGGAVIMRQSTETAPLSKKKAAEGRGRGEGKKPPPLLSESGELAALHPLLNLRTNPTTRLGQLAGRLGYAPVGSPATVKGRRVLGKGRCLERQRPITFTAV